MAEIWLPDIFIITLSVKVILEMQDYIYSPLCQIWDMHTIMRYVAHVVMYSTYSELDIGSFDVVDSVNLLHNSYAYLAISLSTISI